MKTVTIHNLKDSTAQEVYDFIAHHLLMQNERASTITGCVYRTVKPEGKILKCAAGCLIPDEDYDSASERKRWSGTIYAEDTEFSHVYLIESLQLVHDQDEPFNWLKKLKEVAINYDLIPYIPDQV